MLPQFLTSALQFGLRKRQKVPAAFPYYDDVLKNAVNKIRTAQTFKRQILQMSGENPDATTVNFEKLMNEHPEYLHNPLAAYKHRYDNGYPNAPVPDKKFIYIHLQRTAGSTFTHILRRNVRNIAFRRDFVDMPNESPIFALCRFRELNKEDQERERDKWDKYDAFADHSMYGMHEMLRSPYTYITMLRHPVDRLLSYFRYVQRERTDGSPEELKEAELARSLTITEFMYHPFFRMKLNLEQSYVQMLSGYVHPGGYVFQGHMEALLEIAKKNLSTFGAVLLQEEFDTSVQLMCKKFGWKDELLLDDSPIARDAHVIGDQTFSSGAKQQLTEKEYAEVSANLKQDIDVYEYGKQLFAKDLALHGIAPKQEIVNAAAPPVTPKKEYGISETEAYPTSIGPITIALRWAEKAKKMGIDPVKVDTAARHAYYTLNLRRDEFLHQAHEASGIDRDYFRLWLLTLHAHNVCHNVIEQDVYGLRKLKNRGFEPEVIMDIGAHIGVFSLFAHHLWPQAKIIAAEACSPDSLHSDDIGILHRNLQSVPHVQVHQKAIFGLLDAAHLAPCRAELSRDNADHWIELGARGFPRFLGDVIAWNIQAESIMSFLERTDTQRISLLKLCCSGAETNILRELAANNMLEKIDRICGEWHGEMGITHIPAILHATHEIHTTTIAPNIRGNFTATLRAKKLENVEPYTMTPPAQFFPIDTIHTPRRSEPVPMIAHHTAMGALYIQGKWAEEAEKHGIPSHEFNKVMSNFYYKYGQRGNQLASSMHRSMLVPQDLSELWMEYIHSQHICMHVIDNDCYGLRSLKDKGMEPQTIVDIGGHVGTFSLLANKVWPNARIITIEPTNAAGTITQGEILRINTAEIPQISLVNAALIGMLDKENKDERLNELQNDSFNHWMEKGILGDRSSNDAVMREHCRAISVSTLVLEQQISSIDVLKIDCEGAEVNIMRELHELDLLKNIQAIRGEWHGELAKKVLSSLLKSTHTVTFESAEKLTGLFWADRIS